MYRNGYAGLQDACVVGRRRGPEGYRWVRLSAVSLSKIDLKVFISVCVVQKVLFIDLAFVSSHLRKGAKAFEMCCQVSPGCGEVMCTCMES
jgi:hypothetical protein